MCSIFSNVMTIFDGPPNHVIPSPCPNGVISLPIGEATRAFRAAATRPVSSREKLHLSRKSRRLGALRWPWNVSPCASLAVLAPAKLGRPMGQAPAGLVSEEAQAP